MIRSALLFSLLFFFNQLGLAQRTTVQISINEQEGLRDNIMHEYHLTVSANDSILYDQDFVNGISQLQLENVPVGELIVEVRSKANSDWLVIRKFPLSIASTNEVSMTFMSDFQSAKEKEELVSEISNTIISIGAWKDVDIGILGGNWTSLGKHVGLCSGFGLNFERYKINSPILGLPDFTKRQFNSSTNFVLDYRLRFTTSSQKLLKSASRGLVWDFGVQYKLPLAFRYIEVLDQGERLIKSHIHQYRDFRVYSNIGFGPVLLFVEYRPLDFVLGKFAEMPKYNAGIRLSIGTE